MGFSYRWTRRPKAQRAPATDAPASPPERFAPRSSVVSRCCRHPIPQPPASFVLQDAAVRFDDAARGEVVNVTSQERRVDAEIVGMRQGGPEHLRSVAPPPR